MKKFVALGAPSPQLKESLIDRGYSIIDLPRFSLLSAPVSVHPDMLFSCIGDKIITSKDYYTTAHAQLDFIADRSNASVITDPHSDYSCYPHEARFNVLCLGIYVLGNKRAASPIILDECKNQAKTFIHVNQGYARCSTAICGKGIITSDPTIFEACSRLDIPSLKISAGGIELPGYEYGFIGGASGYCEEANTLYFNGDITKHTDHNAILSFADTCAVNIVSLGDWRLFDCGGMFFFR